MQELRAEMWDWILTFLVATLLIIVAAAALIIMYGVMYSVIDFIVSTIKEKSLFKYGKNRRR